MEKTSKVQEPKLFFSAFSAFRAARASRERLDWRCSATADTETPSPQPRSGSPWPPAPRPGRLGAEAAQGGARKGFQGRDELHGISQRSDSSVGDFFEGQKNGC